MNDRVLMLLRGLRSRPERGSRRGKKADRVLYAHDGTRQLSTRVRSFLRNVLSFVDTSAACFPRMHV